MEALRRPRATSPANERALAEQLPLIKRDGGFIREGYEAASTRAGCATPPPRRRRDAGALRRGYRHQGAQDPPQQRARLFRRGHGAARRQADGAALNATFIHRQTLAGQVRFTTSELGEIEAKIANAGDRALNLELEIFERLCAMALAASDDLRAAAHAFALLDVATALAKLAVDDNYVRPEVDGSLGFAVEGGRHPVVEQALKRDGQPFIANACDLSPCAEIRPDLADHRSQHGGQTTFLRQNALIALMAQIGSYVPASRARIGVVDRLFSRVGAADDLARGRSTFMVEMVETAVILNQASERSLVILDESAAAPPPSTACRSPGPRSSTVEGRCRALFATHYHELTALSAKLPRMFNATVRVKERQGDVVPARVAGRPTAPTASRSRNSLASRRR